MKVVYEEKRCREHFLDEVMVGEEAVPMDRHCDLPQHHVGPHSSLTSKRATKERQEWEAANPDRVGERRGSDIVA